MSLNQDHTLEDQLLDRAARGEAAALAHLVHVHKSMAYTIALRIVSSREDAEEVVQDAFMKAFAALTQFKRSSKFSTWLYRIVYNTAITHEKKNTVPTIDIEQHTAAQHIPAPSIDAWDNLHDAERKEYIDRVLETLRLQDRLTVTLFYMGEKTVPEICEILGEKPSAIKMRLLRARKQLADQLGVLLKNELKDFL